MESITRQLNDYRLTTALITYRMPDHLSLLQEYIWQELDLPPRYPELERFIDFWENNLDGPLYSVKVTSTPVIQPARFRMVEQLHRLH